MARRFPNRQQLQLRSRSSNKSWSGIAQGSYTTVATSSKVLLGTFTPSNSGIDETILRSVGAIIMETDNVAASEQQFGSFGMIVVSSLAIAAGIASIPGPVTDVGTDGWFVYVPLMQGHRFSSATSVFAAGVRYDFDSKAKRKIEEGTGIALVVENASATFSFRVALNMRLLSMVTGT